MLVAAEHHPDILILQRGQEEHLAANLKLGPQALTLAGVDQLSACRATQQRAAAHQKIACWTEADAAGVAVVLDPGVGIDHPARASGPPNGSAEASQASEPNSNDMRGATIAQGSS